MDHLLLEIAYVAGGVGFFAVAARYVAFCDGVIGAKSADGTAGDVKR